MRQRVVSRRSVLQVTGTAVAAAVAVPGVAWGGANVRHQVAYVGCYSATDPSIGFGAVNPATGAIVISSWLDDVAYPSWLDRSPDATTLYAISELVPHGQVTALRLDDGAGPRVLNKQQTGSGPAHVKVHPDGRYLFTSLYDAGSVVVHPILDDGQVGAAIDVRHHGGQTLWAAPHIHQVLVDPSGKWVLSVDLGLNKIYVYAFDDLTGRLRNHGEAALRAGAGPRHLAFHPDGAYVYVANERDSTLTTCQWENGELTPGRTVSTLFKPSRNDNHPAEVVVSTDGRFVYVANRGDNTIAVFAVSDTGARLDLIGTRSCGGDWPRHLAIDASGRWLYSVNQRSEDIVWFHIDVATGLPGRPAGRLAVPAAAQLLLV